MKQTQIEPKSTLENHQKNPAKSQMLMRCKIILLKQAIQDAEAIVLKQIGTLSLANIEAAIGHLIDAKYGAKIALQDGFMSVALLDRIRKSLEYAGRKINIPEVRDTWYLANELERLMPTYEVKQGVPMYIMKNYPIETDACENHAKGGWTDFDENGKRKFVMPPYPGVDAICPDCGGYLPQERGAK